MFDIIKESFGITNKYIVLATPLILFSLISSLYILFSVNGNILSLIFALILFFLMLTAFLSGWFYMVKKCVANSEQGDVNGYITEFPAGVGEYFLSVFGMIIISIILSVVLISISYIAGLKFIGDIKDIYQVLISVSNSAEGLRNYIMSLPVDKLVKLNEWNLLVFFTAILTYFLIMFYSPAVFYKQKNPFKAFFISLKDLFCRKFFKNLILFLNVFFIYFILSIVSTLASANIFAHFIFTLVNFYYVVFAVVYVYNYYYKNFVQVGANIDTRV